MNRSILRAEWSGLVDKLSYEAEWYGRAFVRVDRFYPSSKLCHDCGAKYKGLRLSKREWTCENRHKRGYRGCRHGIDQKAARISMDNNGNDHDPLTGCFISKPLPDQSVSESSSAF